jgi:serine/threonine protein kinase
MPRLLSIDAQLSIKIEDQPFKTGGEGGLYMVLSANYKHLVAKLFLPDKLAGNAGKEREQKLRYQKNNPPVKWDSSQHAAIIWVQYLLYDNGAFVGYLMPRASGENLEILCSYKVAKRHQAQWGKFNFSEPDAMRLRLSVCYNVAVAVWGIHRLGRYVLRDMKPENIMINADGQISIIDTDSLQIVENGRLLYAAKVATPDYTPAEYYKTTSDRVEVSWDNFSMAAIFYKLLCGLPFCAGTAHDETLTDMEHFIRAGLFPKGKNAYKYAVIPPPHAQFDKLPMSVRRLFLRAFDEGYTAPQQRPSAEMWCSALAAELGITQKSQPVVASKPIVTPSVVLSPPIVTPSAPPVVFEQNYTVIEKKGKYGFVDEKGKLVIAIKYDYAYSFYEGLASVKLNGKWGYIDGKGQEIIRLKYDDADVYFKEGLARVELNRKYGYINNKGQEIISLKYDGGDSFSESLACVKLNGKYGFINKTGEEIIPLKYDYANSFSEGLASVKLNGKSGFINKIGEIVIPLKYNYALTYSEERAWVMLNHKWGLINKTGQEITPLKYDWALHFSERLAYVELNGKYGFINKTGEEIIPLKYDGGDSFSEGLAGVELNGKYGFINKTGEVIIPFKYGKADSFSEGLARVELNGKYGFINKTGEVIIPFKYDKANFFFDGLAPVQQNGKWGYINKKGKIIIPIKYDKANFFLKGVAQVELNKKKYYINKNNKPIHSKTMPQSDGIMYSKVILPIKKIMNSIITFLKEEVTEFKENPKPMIAITLALCFVAVVLGSLILAIFETYTKASTPSEGFERVVIGTIGLCFFGWLFFRKLNK